MSQKPKKRQGLSLKKINAYQLTKNITQQIQKQQQLNRKPPKGINSIKNITSKRLLSQRSRTSQNTLHHRTQSSLNLIHNIPNPTPKYTKLPLNSPISKCDQNIHHLVQELSPKAKCFYRFGMKSYEKPSHKRVFSDVMNLQPEEMKGCVYVGELWSGGMSKRFMKSNKVEMNKMKFFEKLRDLKWERIRKERERQLDSSNLINSVRQFNQKSQKSIQSIPHFQSYLSFKQLLDPVHQPSQSQSQSCSQSQKKLHSEQFQKNSSTFREALSSIRQQIDSEYKRCKQEEYWKNMKFLQKESGQMHKLWEKYFDKMLVIGG